MKKIGILGGMSWQSTQLYYSFLNNGVNRALGGAHSCDMVLRSFDFQNIKEMQTLGNWADLNDLLSNTAIELEELGCELLLIGANTMHKCAPAIEGKTKIKLIHICDAVGRAIKAKDIDIVGFIGTKYSMEEDFLHEKYRQNQIETIIPSQVERDIIHRIIFDELVNGIINDNSRVELVKICNGLKKRGAKGIIAGCTEIELILRQTDLEFPYFESTRLHCEMALDEILQSDASL